MNIYKPNKEMSVDEAMIKFQGRSTMKQYMPLAQTSKKGDQVIAKMVTFGNSDYIQVYIYNTII